MSNGLDPDEDRRSVGPDLVQTVCKIQQRASKFAASKERVKGYQKRAKFIIRTYLGCPVLFVEMLQIL